MNNTVAGRLAPSPTGLLHLGNAWAFLLAWLAVRKCGGRLILRLEDIDTQRSRPIFAEQLMRDLRWLGLDWDEGPYRQSERIALYEEAFCKLTPHLYPCFCTRKELKELASAPNGVDGQPFYPGTCRVLAQETVQARLLAGDKHSLRLCVPSENIVFTDRVYGLQSLGPCDYGGDFPIRRSDGLFSSQLCCAIDDSLMGISQVVRGRDILVSTARQRILQTLLGLSLPSEYIHFPLLIDQTGVRLAKRHKSLTLASLRERCVAAETIVGYLAYLAGINPGMAPRYPHELVSAFTYTSLPVNDIVLDCERLFL